jgi:hypothetical protein
MNAQLNSLRNMMAKVGVVFKTKELAAKFGVDMKKCKPISFANFCVCVFDLQNEYVPARIDSIKPFPW